MQDTTVITDFIPHPLIIIRPYLCRQYVFDAIKYRHEWIPKVLGLEFDLQTLHRIHESSSVRRPRISNFPILQDQLKQNTISFTLCGLVFVRISLKLYNTPRKARQDSYALRNEHESHTNLEIAVVMVDRGYLDVHAEMIGLQSDGPSGSSDLLFFRLYSGRLKFGYFTTDFL